MKHPKPELDLRQELINLNLNNREVDSWLGTKFDEKEEVEEGNFGFDHDMPLRRSISLDRGIEIFNYLQTLDPKYLSSRTSPSSWTLSSDEENASLRFERYRSFEDIPASPVKVKSGHISLDVTNSVYGNSAFSVLRESYIGVDADDNGLCPRVKKLHKAFSFKNFEDYKNSAKTSIENLNETNVDDGGIEIRIPKYRNIVIDAKEDSDGEYVEKVLRQRRVGVTTNEWTGKASMKIRKEVLAKHNWTHYNSYEDLFRDKKNEDRRGSLRHVSSSSNILRGHKGIYASRNVLDNIRKLQRTLSNRSFKDDQNVPTIVVTGVEDEIEDAGNVYDNKVVRQESQSSDAVDVCNCRICSSDDESDNRPSFLGKSLSKIFMKIVSYKTGKKVTYWDDNEVKEGEMLSCIIYVLKWMLGLWLRHFDHRPHNLCG